MINFRDTISKRPINLIDRDRFIEYYMAISSTIIDDCYFDLLIKNNVAINDMDDDGFTALSIAYRHRKELVVQYLLKNGAKTWIEKTYNPQKKYFINDLNDRWKQ